MVVPAPAPAPPAASRPPAAASGFAVQVGSFGSRANADRLARTLRGDGFAAFVTPSAGDRRLYRVRVGPVTGRAEAEQLAVRLAAARRPGQVVSHP
jgi:DedD protein